MPRDCPKYKKILRSIDRKPWMRRIPGSKYYECRKCGYAYLLIFMEADLIDSGSFPGVLGPDAFLPGGLASTKSGSGLELKGSPVASYPTYT